MKTLYVHIGHYKTGTTSFQAYAAANADGLARRGLCYPEAGRGPSAPTSHADLSIPLAASHGFGPPRWYRAAPPVDDVFAELQCEIDRRPQRKALISSEEFIQLALCADPVAALRDLRSRLAPYRVRVILTVREPMALLKSWYAQVNRGPMPRGTFLDFAAQMNPDFLAQEPIRARVASVFGPRAVRLLRYSADGALLRRRVLWATRTFPFSRAEVPMLNVTESPAEIERSRLVKLGVSGDPAFTTTHTSLASLAAQVEAVHAGYRAITRRLPLAAPSAFSVENVLRHYRDLVAPASARVALDPREAKRLRELAADAPRHLAALLSETADLIDASHHRAARKAAS